MKYSAIALLAVCGALAQTVPIVPLTPPSMPYPADGATGIPVYGDFRWIQASPADSIDIYVGNTPDPPLVASLPGTDRSFSMSPVVSGPAAAARSISVEGTPLVFPLSTTYWRLVARRGSASLSSPVYSFTAEGLLGLRFMPLAPCRVVDTRLDNGQFGKPHLSAGVTRRFDLAQQSGCGIPATALAYSLNVTVVPRAPLGYLTVWPGAASRPLVSTLNSADGRVKANAAIVPIGSGASTIAAFATSDTDLVLDINGYFIDPELKPNALAFYPLSPCRISDTRNPTGSLGGPVIGGGTSRSIPVLSSNCGVPANAQAYSLNATVVPQTTLGYLTLWPKGQPQPLVSTLNAPTGTVVANAAIVPAGTGGAIDAYMSDASHLVLDINGYFAPAGAAGSQNFNPVSPCRILDTRDSNGEFGGPVLSPDAMRSYRPALANCGLPLTAGTFSLNATVVPTAGLGYLTMWPFGSAQPLVSTLNAADGAITSNAAIVPAGGGGEIAGFVTNQTHLVLDVNGYFGARDCYMTVAPASAVFESPGGNGSFNVSSNCAEDASAPVRSASWLTVVPPAGGAGTGIYRYSAGLNAGLSRSATIRIGHRSFTVLQSARLPD